VDQVSDDDHYNSAGILNCGALRQNPDDYPKMLDDELAQQVPS
jgi:hypothetical protein